MGRLRWLVLSSKLVPQKFLTIPAKSSDEQLCRNISQFQRHLIHFSSNNCLNTSSHWRWCTRNNVNIASNKLQWWTRYIHATGTYHSAQRDYYEILGISEGATRDEIKKAFLALAKKYHPDANKNNPSAKRKFQEVREAYETLRDPKKKAQYDGMREGSGRTEYAEHPNMHWDNSRYANRAEFSDSFHKIFSEIFENEAENLGGDIQVDLLLNFSEAAIGFTKQLSFNADVPCESCDGHGHPLDAKTKLCLTCRGTGRVTMPPFTTTCGRCKGFGRIIEEYCMTCRGLGVCEGVRHVKVTIPAGVDSGDTIRVPKAGNFGGSDRSPGDLFIKIKVADDPIFSRKGADIYVDSRINFTQAILGGSIEVPSLSGNMQIQIPKGVQHGQLILLRNKGLPKSGFLVNRGDQYVRFCIKLPSTVNEKQRAILENFEETIDENNRLPEGSWLQWITHMTWPRILEFSILIMTLLYIGKVLT